MASVQSKWSAAFDNDTYALNVISYEHHEVHGGASYDAFGTVDLASGGTMNIAIVTPNTLRYSHAVLAVSSELEAAINFYEGFVPSGTADGGTIGVAVTAYNRNRNVSTTATTLVYTGATVGTAVGGTAGTLIWATHQGGGAAAFRFGGEQRGVSEWVLKANTRYLFQIINATTSANYNAWEVDWYEHTNKE